MFLLIYYFGLGNVYWTFRFRGGNPPFWNLENVLLWRDGTDGTDGQQKCPSTFFIFCAHLEHVKKCIPRRDSAKQNHRFFFYHILFYHILEFFEALIILVFIIFLTLRIFYHIFLYHILKFLKIFIIFYIIFFDHIFFYHICGKLNVFHHINFYHILKYWKILSYFFIIFFLIFKFFYHIFIIFLISKIW